MTNAPHATIAQRAMTARRAMNARRATNARRAASIVLPAATAARPAGTTDRHAGMIARLAETTARGRPAREAKNAPARRALVRRVPVHRARALRGPDRRAASGPNAGSVSPTPGVPRPRRVADARPSATSRSEAKVSAIGQKDPSMHEAPAS